MEHNPSTRNQEVNDRRLLEASLDPIVAINLEGKFAYVNEAMVRVTGIQRDALIGSDHYGYLNRARKGEGGPSAGYNERVHHRLSPDLQAHGRAPDGRTLQRLRLPR